MVLMRMGSSLLIHSYSAVGILNISSRIPMLTTDASSHGMARKDPLIDAFWPKQNVSQLRSRRNGVTANRAFVNISIRSSVAVVLNR